MSAKGLRNVGFFGHAGSGKTTICDGILFLAGANNRFGKVSEGSSIFDTDPEELKRGCSLSLGLATFPVRDCTFTIIDTPGYSDFIGEALSGVEAVDTAVIVIDAATGIAVGTERMLNQAEKKGLPVIFFINKLKKENADFSETLKAIADSTKRKVVALNLPIGTAEKFSGVCDLLKNKASVLAAGALKEIDVPADMKDKMTQLRDHLIEAAAETDDNLMNKYVDGKEIALTECLEPIKKGLLEGKISLCLCGEGLDLIGIGGLLDVLADFAPAPEQLPDLKVGSAVIKRSEAGDFAGYVFKTVVEAHLGELCYIRVFSGRVPVGTVLQNTTRGSEEKINQIYLMKGKEKKETNQLAAGMICALVKLKDTRTADTLTGKTPVKFPGIDFPAPSISMAVIPKAKGDEEKISNGMNRLRTEDPTFSFSFDPEIKQMIISGIGELHLDVILARLTRKYGVSVDLAKPRMKYRETFTRKTEAQGKYKKQTGGHGQYGDCWLKIEPLSRGKGFEFEDAISQGRIPNRYIPSVEKGVREYLETGFLAGYPLADIKVSVYDGSYHEVDSSDIAFKIAASMAMKANAERGNVVLLEPISEVEVYVPEEYMGDVIGDLNSRRGKIMGMEAVGRNQMIKTLVPEAEMYKYSTSLRSMTQGRGYFTMKFHHYEEVPREISLRIIEEAKREKK